MRHILFETEFLGGAALAVVTAQVFLIAQLHQDVAVGSKPKESDREAVDHGSAAGCETKEQCDGVGGHHSVQNVHATAANNFARRHESGFGCVMSTRQLGSVMGTTVARFCFKHSVTSDKARTRLCGT